MKKSQENIQKKFADHVQQTKDKRKDAIGRWTESLIFEIAIILWELFMIIIYAIWFEYRTDLTGLASDVTLYPFFRDVVIMIFFGFGLLMTYMRRGGFNATGFSFLIAALVCQWSIILQIFFEELNSYPNDFNVRRQVGINEMINGAFCAGAVLISYGALHGKVNPLQCLIMSFFEPFFYWLNMFIGSMKLEALDIGGGMFIHTFGCYFGLAACFFLTNPRSRAHPDNTSNYASDIFAMLGSLFLWMMWPSFNAATAVDNAHAVRAMFNTFISLCGSGAITFVFSRFLTHGQKFDMVHIQNSILAGGVVMGVAADMDMHPSVPIGTGIFIGTISVLGYRFLTPFMTTHLHIQDICGINNLHGIPGVVGAIVGIWATTALGQEHPEDYPHGRNQAGYQTAALVISIGIGIGAGAGTGLLMWLADKIRPMHRREYFNDRMFWHLPSDYEKVDRDENWEEQEKAYDEHHMRGMKIHKVFVIQDDSDSESEDNDTEMTVQEGRKEQKEEEGHSD